MLLQKVHHIIMFSQYQKLVTIIKGSPCEVGIVYQIHGTLLICTSLIIDSWPGINANHRLTCVVVVDRSTTAPWCPILESVVVRIVKYKDSAKANRRIVIDVLVEIRFDRLGKETQGGGFSRRVRSRTSSIICLHGTCAQFQCHSHG